MQPRFIKTFYPYTFVQYNKILYIVVCIACEFIIIVNMATELVNSGYKVTNSTSISYNREYMLEQVLFEKNYY